MGTQIAPVAVSDTRNVQQNVSAVVRMLMALRGLNQTELAEAVHTGQPRISDKLAGRRRWHVEDVAILANYFKVPIGTFFEDADEVFKTGSFTTLVGLPATLTPELPFPPAGRQLAAVGQG